MRVSTQSTGTVGKALDMLSLLGEHPDGATAHELADASGHHFSTAYRLLRTLVATGFAEHSPQDKRYRLGLPVFQLGQKVAHARGFDASAAPVLQGLVETTGESCLLAVLHGQRFLTTAKIDGPDFRVTTDPGDQGTLHSSAIGRVLLAYAPAAERDRLLESIHLPARTESTLTERDRLRELVAQTQRQGFASQSEEHDDGMAAVAVPVLDPAGGLIAALCLAAPIFRSTREDLQDQLPLLREAADQLAAVLPPRPR